jgi:hypothetical protein
MDFLAVFDPENVDCNHLTTYQRNTPAPQTRGEVQVDYNRLFGTLRGSYTQEIHKSRDDQGSRSDRLHLRLITTPALAEQAESLHLFAAPEQIFSIFTMYTYRTCVGVRKRALDFDLPPGT